MPRPIESKKRHGNRVLILVVTTFSIVGVVFLVGVLVASSKLSKPDSMFPLESDPHLPPQRLRRRGEASHSYLNTDTSNRSRFCAEWPKCTLPPREPSYRPLCDLLKAWSPDDPNVPRGGLTDALPVFNYGIESERFAAQSYREAELPLVLEGVPELDATNARWTDDFLKAAFASMENSKKGHKYKIERSIRKGHFLYYSKGHARSDWNPPTEMVGNLAYQDYESAASKAEKHEGHVEGGLLYLTISASLGGVTQWVLEGLSFLKDNKYFRVNYPAAFHGINCRFGMKGIVQAAHYDHGRNFIAMVSGHKRYVILPPRACPALELLDKSEPTARHASFDWADEAELEARQGQPFCSAEATELVLGPKQVLYLPSYWFHYIVSLDKTVQCNSRSGNDAGSSSLIEQCMRSAAVKAKRGAGW
mmetsp:Transcript_52905/g.120583  ORF Transcript_52905/g.120583 Transcript_52905/m.120583 type:complete len:420 (+) Transcript_52905:245-1504(+)|eukprot:CAMPEP_0172624580 /NCGR_PEP_ID=MMETSP1068-20121228/137753_1 /TAXON_ID=35684 /ORGANISM="Pseudopedinella elastica, Strain CCMP716" /LENGTH=419 /DNA_ID=CAMNT_0013433599 /DNA_START=175 /DNA_END=1434 /DNA_ORIENTATION=+